MKNLPKIICMLSFGIVLSKASAQTDSAFNYTGAVQIWTVPCGISQVTVVTIGGAGGGSTINGAIGGTGATITGVVSVTPGDVINIYVGSAGITNTNNDGGGGGGGTFIYDVTAGKLLEVAGGGGGAYWDGPNGFNASIDTVPTGTNGGVGQGGGRATRTDAGGGGASFINNGATNGNIEAGTGGNDQTNGFTGGIGDSFGFDGYCMGGYGGGGGCGWNGGGGGGGYNGGGVDTVFLEPGGGGGSFVVNNDTLSTMDTNMGNGLATIIYNPFTVTGNIISNINCNGGNNGSASAIVSNGVTPYTYSWAPSGGSSDTATGLTAGVYTITVADNNGCIASATAIITQPNLLTGVSITATNVTCDGGNNGSASANPIGGGSPFTYSWAPSGQSSDTITGLTPGSYTVTVNDACGATASASVTITQPNILTGVSVTGTNVSCNSGNNGSASATPIGGGSPFTYSWTPSGGSSAIANRLTAGSYTVTVNDACGGTASASVTITQPNTPLNAVTSMPMNLTCNGSSNGSDTVFAGGGTAPYTYSWAPSGGTDAIGMGLSAGNYTVTVTDNNGCTASATTTITQPNALIAATSMPMNLTCNGNSNGSDTAFASGGTMPYTYSWTPSGGSSAIANGLTAGVYTVTVNDACGATASAPVTITQPNALTAVTSTPMNLTCNGSGNGSDTVFAGGGTGPYTYSWAPSGGTNSIAMGLSAGSYTVTITDNNGCTVSVSTTITQPNILTAAVSMPMNASCNGNSNGRDTAIAGGGTAPYTYSWAPSGGTGAIGVGLSAGSYTVTVIDKNGCNATASATITQPADLQLVMSVTNALGNPCNGGASVNVTGGTAPYTYSWTGGGTNDTIAGKCVGDYCCIVTDKNGCVDSSCIHIKNITATGNISSGSTQITVYPNPTNGQFTMRLPSAGQQLSVEIYNVLGEKVYSQFNIQNPTFNINLGNQPNGIYLYRVISGSGTLIGQGKIILQK